MQGTFSLYHFTIIVLLLLCIVPIGLLYVFWRKMRAKGASAHQRYGTWAEAWTAVATALIGIAGLLISWAVYQAGEDARADAASHRVVELIAELTSQERTETQAISAKDATATAGTYSCVGYLKDRLQTDPEWGARLQHGPYMMDPAVLGTMPDGDNKTVVDAFHACVGNQPASSDVVARGLKIGALIHLALRGMDLLAMEWVILPSDAIWAQGARARIEKALGAQLCASKSFGDDVVSLFEYLRGKVTKAHAGDDDFELVFLRTYANLNELLHRKRGCAGLTPALD